MKYPLLFDFMKLKSKAIKDFETWHQLFYRRTKKEFPKTKEGRITGDWLPERITKEKAFFRSELPDHKKRKVVLCETLNLDTGDLERYLESSFCVPKAISGNDRNDQIFSHDHLLNLIKEIERYYGLPADQLIMQPPEVAITLAVEENFPVNEFIDGTRMLMLGGKQASPMINYETSKQMGYKTKEKGVDFYFKFYSVGEKYETGKNLFRFERKFTRVRPFKEITGIHTLDDLRNQEKIKAVYNMLIDDISRTVITDPSLRETGIYGRERDIVSTFQAGIDVVKSKVGGDSNKLKRWCNEYTLLSEKYGDGLYSKLFNGIS